MMNNLVFRTLDEALLSANTAGAPAGDDAAFDAALDALDNAEEQNEAKEGR